LRTPTTIAAASGFEMPGYLLVRVVFILAAIVFLIAVFSEVGSQAAVARAASPSRNLGVRRRRPRSSSFGLLTPRTVFPDGPNRGYMTTGEIERQTGLVGNTAHALAWSLSHPGLPRRCRA